VLTPPPTGDLQTFMAAKEDWIEVAVVFGRGRVAEASDDPAKLIPLDSDSASEAEC